MSRRRKPVLRPLFLPLGFGLVVSGSAWYRNWDFSVWYQSWLAVQFGVGAALSVGIAGTSVALVAIGVLIGMSRTHLSDMMHQTGHHRDLVVSLAVGLAAFMACAYVGMVEVVEAYDRRLPMPVAAGLLASGALFLVDISRKFWLVQFNLLSD